MKRFKFGWNRASRFIERLNDMGLVENLDAKLPRRVLPKSVDNISEDVVDFLLRNGVSMRVPINQKMTLTIRESAEYSNIGINKIDSMLKQLGCPFVLFIGTRKLVKRKEFEKYISEKAVI